MNYDLCKFERGQVWMVRFKYPEAVGHEQKKDRPWLVLSVGKFNKSSGMVTMVPITTRNAIVSPSQVLFVNDRGMNNVILCENIRTFDHSSGAYIFDFMGNISDEILEKVDVAISIHLGLHYSPITLKKLYDSMEAIIKSVAYMEDKTNTPKFTDEDVLQFAEKLKTFAVTKDDTVNDTKVDDFDKHFETNRTEVKYPTQEDVVEVNTTEYKDTSLPSQDTTSNVEVKSKRIKWTVGTCNNFLNDANNLPMKEVMQKWGISKKTRYYSMKSYAESLLKKMQ